MEESFDELTDGQLLAIAGAALDALTDDRLRLPSDAEQLALLKDALRLDARLQAWQQQLAARIEASDAAWHEYGTSTTTWLADAARLTPREARRLVRAGQGLARFEVVGRAAAAGALVPGQAEAITSVLADLPTEFDPTTVVRGQELMVGFAATHDAAALRRLTSHLVEVLDPDTADTLTAARLERQERAARARRHLEFVGDGQGNVQIRGSLPVADAEPFIRIIDAYAAADKRAALEARDPLSELVTPAMRRADALVTMVNRHCQESLAPASGGDRPRVVVTLSYDSLAKTAADAGLLAGHLVGSQEPLSAGVLRRLLCDADVLPAVLGGQSEVLDVGRTQRLVTAPIRAALELRDGGCVFPGCEKPPQDCHAHHLQPWWAGGPTSLGNLVLVCAHHHGIVEPGHDPTADRWRVRLRDDGRAEIVPPLRADPTQRPRVHARFLTPRRE